MQPPAPVPLGATQKSAWISHGKNASRFSSGFISWKTRCVNQKSNNTKMQGFFSSCKYSTSSTVGLCLNWGLQKYFLGLEASPLLLLNQWTSPEVWAHTVFSLIFPRKPFELAQPGADVPPSRSPGEMTGECVGIAPPCRPRVGTQTTVSGARADELRSPAVVQLWKGAGRKSFQGTVGWHWQWLILC